MSILSAILLLAAYSSAVIAGPVPQNVRRQLFTSYANISSIAPSTSEAAQASHSAVDLSSALIHSNSAIAPSTLLSQPSSLAASPAKSSTTAQSVEANTAVVVEPIQQTIFTSVIPGVTFLNPDGKPLITDDPQTILSTSYITPTPAPVPSTKESSSSLPAPSTKERPSATSVPSIPDMTAVRSSRAVATTSVLAVKNSTTTETSQRIPQFTYSPEQSTESLLASSSASASASAKNPAPSSGGLPGFNHPSSASQGAPNATSSVVNGPAGQASASPSLKSSQPPALSLTTSPSSLALSTAVALPSDVASSRSRIVITKTEYTTVFPTPTASKASASEPAVPSQANNTPPAPPASSQIKGPSTASTKLQGSTISPVSTAAAALPTTPLEPPPVVTITQYTTVAPTPDPQPTQAPAAPSNSVVPAPAPSAPVPSAPASPFTSIAVQPTATPPVASSSSPPIQPPAVPTNAPAPPPQASSSAAQAPQPPPAPTNAPAAPSSPPTSDGPLIITPIPPSQIFTVTVTEKETIRETVTVTTKA